MMQVRQVLDHVRDAATHFNYAVSMAKPSTPISEIFEPLIRLERAVSRATVLAQMHPRLELDAPAPAGAISDQDKVDQMLTTAALEHALTLPSGPASVTLRAKPLEDGSPEDQIRQWLDGRSLTGKPDGGGYEVDLSGLVAFLADTFFPDDADLGAGIPMSDTPAARSLRERFGPRRRKEDQ